MTSENLAELPDELDRAAAITAVEREEGIAAARRSLVGTTYSHCKDCGEVIPAARQALGNVKRCIDCAERIEFNQRQHRK